ncbi:hypothetical protein MRX96_037758 [Rhipicephalus microplus]
MLLEEALREVGDFGRFQWLLIVYLCVFVAPLRVLPLFGHIFSLLVPPHRCRLDPWLQEALGGLHNATADDADLLLDLALPREPDGSFSQCHMYDANSTLALWFDFGWEYDFSYFYPSVVSEMNWVCDNAWKAYVSNTAFWVATAIGVLICGDVSDRIGRVPVMIGVNVMCGAAGLYTYFTAGFVHFVVSRVFVGLFVLAVSIMPFVLGHSIPTFQWSEYVAPERRMMVLSAFQFSYPLVGAAFPWMAYALADWRTLTLVCAVPPLAAPFFSWFVPESLRWLVSRGKEQRSKKILVTIAKINGKKLSDDFMQRCQFPPPNEFHKTKASPIDMLKTPNLRKNFVLSLIVWTLACLVYTAGQLPTMMTAYAAAAVAYICSVGVPKESLALGTAVFMLARVALTMAYNVGYLYAAEVYPTAARSQALSLRQAFGSVGKFLSSQVTQLAMYGRPIPLLLMGAMSFQETSSPSAGRVRSLSVISAASAVSVSPD